MFYNFILYKPFFYIHNLFSCIHIFKFTYLCVCIFFYSLRKTLIFSIRHYIYIYIYFFYFKGCNEYHNIYKKIKLNNKFLEDLKFCNLNNNKAPTCKYSCK